MVRRWVMREYGMEENEAGGWVMYEEVRHKADLEEENKRLQEALKDIINDFYRSRPLSIGGIDTHREIRYSHKEIQRLKNLMEGGG